MGGKGRGEGEGGRGRAHSVVAVGINCTDPEYIEVSPYWMTSHISVTIGDTPVA